MSFEPVVYLKPGDQFAVRTSAQGPAFLPGTPGILPDGRKFRYAQMGAVAGVVGKLYQAPIPVTNHVLQTAAAAPVGQTYVDLTLGATAAAANDYIGGLLTVDLVGNTGFGYSYTIGAHPAVGSGAVFRVPFAGSDRQVPQSDGLIVAGNESVQVAIATTANSVSVYPNPYKKVIVNPTTITARVAGVTVAAIAASGWGWLQTYGDCMCITDGTVVIGQPVMPSNGAAGAVEAWALTEGTPNVVIAPQIGLVTRVAVNLSYSTIFLQLE